MHRGHDLWLATLKWVSEGKLVSSLSGRTIQRVAILSDRCDSPLHRADVDGAVAAAGDELRGRVRFAGAIELKGEARKLN